MHTGEVAVSVNGSALSGWKFDAMNVLTWSEEAGCSAWLQFMVLPSGPVFMGTLKTPDQAELAPGKYTANPPAVLSPMPGSLCFNLCPLSTISRACIALNGSSFASESGDRQPAVVGHK